jgi:PAS domain S-box-containing protein
MHAGCVHHHRRSSEKTETKQLTIILRADIAREKANVSLSSAPLPSIACIHHPSANQSAEQLRIEMTTHLQYSTGKLSCFLAALSRPPSSSVGPTLLSIIQSARDGVVIVDARRRIILVNHKAEHMFGYLAEDLLEKPLELLVPVRPGTEQQRRLDRLATTRVNGKRTKIELKGMRSSGEQVSLKASVSRLMVHGELLIALILHDTGLSRKAGEERQNRPRPHALRQLAFFSQQANEAEKRRFSQKLYDDIGQRLGVLKLDLDWLENSLSDTEKHLPARVARMQGLLDHVIRTTKSVASALRPPLLDDFGLLPAVEWMAESFQKKTAIRCTVENHGVNVKLDETVESSLFRVVQEGLSNIERHAYASSAKIVFAHAENRLDVMIQDDGVGLTGDSDSDSKPGCYGLIAMQERVFVLGGTISIRNVRPHGVAIRASIPIEPVFPLEPISQPPTSSL